MDIEEIKKALDDAEALYNWSGGRHLCAICGNMPLDYVNSSTGFWHPCPFMDEMTDSYGDFSTGRFDSYSLNLEDNGSGFWVTSCGFFKNRPGRYDIYISNSKTWKDKRDAVLKRDGYRCRICGSGKNLHVHHITYERLFHEELDDLLTVCNKCHRKLHSEDVRSTRTKHEIL